MEKRCENCANRFEQVDLIAAHRNYVGCSLGFEYMDRKGGCRYYVEDRS